MSTERALLLAALLAAVPAAAQLGTPVATPPGQAPNAVGMQTPPEPPVLGRLFFTPAERARLDELRRRPPPPPQAVSKPEPPPMPPEPKYVTLNGIVRRSDGTTTVWLNNKPVRGRSTEEGILVTPAQRPGTPGNVTLQVPQSGHVVDLKVGQQVEIHSGQVQEAYRTPRGTVAAGGQADTAAEPPSAAPAPRRSNRERDLLRDLLREIEGPDAARPENAASSPPRAR